MNPGVNLHERTATILKWLSSFQNHFSRQGLQSLINTFSRIRKRWSTILRKFVAELGFRERIPIRCHFKTPHPNSFIPERRQNWAIAPECTRKCGQFYLHAGIMIGTWPVAVRHHTDTYISRFSSQPPVMALHGRFWAPEQNHKDNHNVVGWLLKPCRRVQYFVTLSWTSSKIWEHLSIRMSSS